MRTRRQRGSASVWAVIVIAGAFTVLFGLVVDGGRAIDARVAAARTAAQAARVGADALSSAGVRNGHDTLDTAAAKARARRYLHEAGMTGTVTVSGRTVTVTVTGRSANEVLGVIGIGSFPIAETESAQAVTEEGAS